MAQHKLSKNNVKRQVKPHTALEPGLTSCKSGTETLIFLIFHLSASQAVVSLTTT